MMCIYENLKFQKKWFSRSVVKGGAKQEGIQLAISRYSAKLNITGIYSQTVFLYMYFYMCTLCMNRHMYVHIYRYRGMYKCMQYMQICECVNLR